MTRADLLRALERYGEDRAGRDAYNEFFDRVEDCIDLTLADCCERAFRRWYNDAETGTNLVGDEGPYESIEDAAERVAAFLRGYVPEYQRYFLSGAQAAPQEQG